MATIEQLNFEVILNDKAFNKAIEADLKAAENLNTQLSRILNLKKQLNGQTTEQIVNAEKVRQAEEKTAQQVAKTALAQEKVKTQIEKTSAAQKGFSSSVLQTRQYLTSTEKIMRTISQLTGVAFSVVGLRRFLESLIKITGEFEVQRMALRNMLQDIDGADKIFEDLYRFSSESTYRFSELAKYAKQLAAFNIGQNNLLETTKMLGDVASGVGVSMDRLILAYGHVKSSGFLRGIQLRSFSQNGVPILDELAKMFSEVENRAVSLGEVFDKMTKREIPFEMVEEAFRRMTSEGGKFYQMQEVLAKTLAGQINILKGRWENMLAAIGQANDGLLKGAVEKLNDLVLNYEKLGKVIAEMIAIWGSYRLAVFITTAATEGLTAATNVGLIGALKNVAKWVATNPYALIAAGITYAVIEIVKAKKELGETAKIVKALTDVTEDYNNSLDSEIGELDALFAAIRNAKEGTKEFDLARQALEKRFNPYIQKLREEGVEVSNLSLLYDGLAQKITEANKQKFLERAQEDISNAYTQSTKSVNADFEKIVQDMRNEGIKLTAMQEGALRHFMYSGQQNSDFKSIAGLDNRRYRETVAPNGGGVVRLGDERTFRERLSDVRMRWDRAGYVLSESMGEAIKRFDASVDKATDTGGKKSDDELVYRISSIVEGIKKADAEIEKIRGKARSGSITQGEKDKLDALIKDREAQAKEYEEIMGIKYDKDTRGVAKGESAAERMIREKVADIKGDISILEKFGAAYEKLRPIIGDDAARAWVFENMGHDVSNLDSELEELIDDLRELGEDGAQAADEIEARLGLDKASKAYKQFVKDKKAAEDAQKALQKYLDTIQDWADKNQELSGTGSAFDISRDLAKYNKALADADKKAKDSLKNLLYGTTDGNNRLAGYANINAQWMRARANALVTLQNDMTKRADDVFKEQLAGFDLTNWNDKTLSQIIAIREVIKNVEIPQEIKDELEGDTEAAAALQQAFNKLKQDTLDRTVSPEMFKKISKEAKRISGYLGNAASKMREFAEATGNTKLADTAEVVGMLAQNMQAAADGAESWGGWWGAIIGGVTDLFDQMTSGLTEAAKKANELDKSVKEIRSDARLLAQTSLFSDDGIFGVNGEKNIQGAVEAMKNLREHMKSLGNPEITRAGTTFWERMSLGWRLFHNIDHIATEEYIKQGSLTDVMARYGLNVYDQYGNLDPNSIREVIKLFGDQDGVLEQLAKDAEAYAEAMKVVENVAESLIGSVVEDLTDKIVDSWWEAGSAALDYADILGDVAKAYAKLIVNDMLLDAAFDEQRQKAFVDALKSGDTGKAMSIIEGAMQSAVDMLPAVNEALQVLEPYRISGGSESNSIGAGIKGITEDTANLLASYINAIRADVSYIRLLQERGLESIDLLGSSVPTINEHLAQIAATNFDIAQSNQSILSELRAVIGAPGTSGMVVRVEAY